MCPSLRAPFVQSWSVRNVKIFNTESILFTVVENPTVKKEGRETLLPFFRFCCLRLALPTHKTGTLAGEQEIRPLNQNTSSIYSINVFRKSAAFTEKYQVFFCLLTLSAFCLTLSVVLFLFLFFVDCDFHLT